MSLCSKSQHFQELMHPAQRRSGVFLPPPLDANPVASTSVSSTALKIVIEYGGKMYVFVC